MPSTSTVGGIAGGCGGGGAAIRYHPTHIVDDPARPCLAAGDVGTVQQEIFPLEQLVRLVERKSEHPEEYLDREDRREATDELHLFALGDPVNQVGGELLDLALQLGHARG